MTHGQPFDSDWLIRGRPQPQARCRLFCFPFAGGSAAAYRAWPHAFPPEIEVCAVQLPGREQRLLETPLASLETLLDRLVPVIEPSLDRPFAFFGYSMGTLISFELARRLAQTRNILPEHLFVAARRAPHLPDPDPPMHHLPADEFIAELRRFQGTPEAVLQNLDLMSLLLPALRGDFAICETYRYQPTAPLDCPISVFGGVDDPHISLVDLLAWRHHTRRTFKPRLLAGDHFFLFGATVPLTQAIVADLQACLDPQPAEPRAVYASISNPELADR